MFKVKTYNQIHADGLSALTSSNIDVGADLDSPDAILLRSHKLHDEPIDEHLLAVARAGAGVNNVPVEKLSKLGIPVFNTPGANANAVKELVIAGLLLASRHICQGWAFTQTLTENTALDQHIEAEKKAFKGSELPHKTIAVIGLGAIGVKVANTALQLGMQAVGFDPQLSVARAHELSSSVHITDNLHDALSTADFITLHVPLLPQTEGLIGVDALKAVKPGATLLNFARKPIVNTQALLSALDGVPLQAYVTDFPDSALIAHPKVITLPHLGASTWEAERNCALMAADALKAFLLKGHLVNAVNFPNVQLPHTTPYRLSIFNANIPNMIGQVSTVMGKFNLNIVDMLNKSQGEVAYTLIDVSSKPTQETLQALSNIEGVLKLRSIEG